MRWLILLCAFGCAREEKVPSEGVRAGELDMGVAAVSADMAQATGPLLKFAVFGDARPPLPEESWNYPSKTVKAIFAAAQSNGAQFVVGTGDYMNALTQSAVDQQLAQLVEAESQFSGPVYHALGNHECLTKTQVNCPKGDESPAIRAYMDRLVPTGTAKPYYRVDFDTRFGKAKIILIAGNAWSNEQNDWLKHELADKTEYTFVVRHVPSGQDAPGVAESDAILQTFEATTVFFVHEHEFRHLDSQHVICGNGGAPLSDKNGFYGLLIVEQQADGNFALTELDVATGMPVEGWRVTPLGQPAP